MGENKGASEDAGGKWWEWEREEICGEGRSLLRGIEERERERGGILLLCDADDDGRRAVLLLLLNLSSMAFAKRSVGPSSSSVTVGCF